MDESSVRVGHLLGMARTKSKKTQKEVANAIGVTSKTVQNWENGISSISLQNWFEYFSAIGLNPISYLQAYVYPTVIDNQTTNVSKEALISDLNNLLHGLTDTEIQDLIFILRGDHGSSPYAVLQEVVANLHNSMAFRYIVAECIRAEYEREECLGICLNREYIKPDIDAFKRAIERGREASFHNNNGYTVK